MPVVKEYRIPMPVTTEEYQVAQIYMTARAQAMEAEQEDGAGVEIVENKPCNHPKLGKGVYTKKHYHIDRRFPGWLRVVAPKSGTTLIEESYNCFPKTHTTLTLPLFSKFKITVESCHLDDNGRSENVHGLSPQALKKREVVFLNIAERSEEEKKKKMYDKDTADPSTWQSKRTGRGPLKKGWQDSSRPVMTAYKLVTAEFDYWPIGGRIEEFVHSYETGIFLSANRQMTCWMDEWHGMTMDDVRQYENDTAERTNKITAIREGRVKGRIEDVPEVKPVRSADNAAKRAPPPPTAAMPDQAAAPAGPPQVAPAQPPSQPMPRQSSLKKSASQSRTPRTEALPARAEPPAAPEVVASRGIELDVADAPAAPGHTAREAPVPVMQTVVQPQPVQAQTPTRPPQLTKQAQQQFQPPPQPPQSPPPAREPILPPQKFPTETPSSPELPAQPSRQTAAEPPQRQIGTPRDARQNGSDILAAEEMLAAEKDAMPDAEVQMRGQGKNGREGEELVREGSGAERGPVEEGWPRNSKGNETPPSPFGNWNLEVPKFEMPNMPSMPDIPFFPQSPKVLRSPSKRSRSQQRDPGPDEPICSSPNCGKYGQYTMVDGGAVVCSIQCKLLLTAHRHSPVKLPGGWERRVTAEGKEYFLDHNSASTTWTSPVTR